MLLKLESIWHKTETQMDFLKQIWDSLDAKFQTNQLLLLGVLESKLQEAINLLNSVIGIKSDAGHVLSLLLKRGPLRKTKYVLSVKETLDKILSDLLEWRDLFDPSWYLLSRVSNQEVDRILGHQPKDKPLKLLDGLRKSVRDLNVDAENLPIRTISSRDFLGPRLHISSSASSLATIEGRAQYGIVDTMPVNPSMDPIGTTRRVMSLSKALSRVDPFTFGLLRCCGVINKNDKYEFVFEIPLELEMPKSLRTLLLGTQPSLNIKVELAKQLAKSVFYVHAIGFVHKNIRPETILVFDRRGDRSLFLCGFENFRAAQDETFKVGDSLPERELYRHPLRQGNNPGRRYVMQHDIYSLGVCLLEIGLWKSFVWVEGDDTLTQFTHLQINNDAKNRAFVIKQEMLLTVKDLLAQETGERFKEIVEICLTCLDNDSTWDQVEDNEALDTGIGVEFIENVLLQLHEIVV